MLLQKRPDPGSSLGVAKPIEVGKVLQMLLRSVLVSSGNLWRRARSLIESYLEKKTGTSGNGGRMMQRAEEGERGSRAQLLALHGIWSQSQTCTLAGEDAEDGG